MTRGRRRIAALPELEGHRVPSPPPELAAETLALARFAAVVDPRRGWADRLWENTFARWLWVAATCCLLLANLAAMRAPAPAVSSISAVYAAAGRPSIRRSELVDLAGPTVFRWRGPLLGASGGRLERANRLAMLGELPDDDPLDDDSANVTEDPTVGRNRGQR